MAAVFASHVPGFSEDEAVLLTGQAYSRGVDDGHHDLNMLRDDAIKQLLVAVHQRHQVDVTVKVVLPHVEVRHGNSHLSVLVHEHWRHESVDSKQLAFL